MAEVEPDAEIPELSELDARVTSLKNDRVVCAVKPGTGAGAA